LTLRTVRLHTPRSGALDAGLRHRPFPDDTASLLPGLLIATRTGLTPASDDELTNQPSTTYMINHQPFWTHWRTEMTNRFAVWNQIINRRSGLKDTAQPLPFATQSTHIDCATTIPK
jgi:hypothetical protein